MSLPSLISLPDKAAGAFAWVAHPPLQAILKALDAAGGAPMFVGGCVRDSLYGVPPDFDDPDARNDIDIATVLTPGETVKALQAAGMKAVPTGIEHGTVTAMNQGMVAEITTLRADIATDGRHAQVAFTADWDQDWRRRDFTINALYLTPDLQLYDPAGGLDALERKSVCFIGEAEERIREDYLRILRFYRFSARYADDLDGTGSAACRSLREGLDSISKERIGQEMMKILSGPRRGFILPAMEADGILERVWPHPADINVVAGLAEMPEAVAAEVMLAGLWPSADPGGIGAALRLSNASNTRRRDALEAASALTDMAPDERRARVLVYHFGDRAFRDGALLAMARFGEAAEADYDSWQAALALADNWHVPDFPITARQLIDQGLEPGPDLGAALKQAEALWIERDFPVDDMSLATIRAEAVQQADD
ncbi:CCA tRNA nucleotidyltransferase [Aquisalinus flavus]|uniref:Poly(A) polymerase/tRNA-nucleotidyltransferase n=1 Tax=Aquisalinus flavus TaxID=1526572 RepID=A0A8J2V3Z6_9PROT|nr:CCA tRNA nucleotidyltransferase [Aquisalinus flavus]MBD0426850.1 CCA tRNA nucleotidyltransferase [Aquisalinus flavus]UNE46697.1 CCA tRNA nucleotidyltransferase [Aquisalinus flavus]GGC96481.1 poly(A) polymerase/tRNA-nucleotidyltransferase [Aquisalinus flavus]